VDRLLMYHNPVCTQSRGVEEILRERGVDCEVIRYLDNPLSREDFERILTLLPNESAELVRKDERFRELGLNEADYQTSEQVIEVLLAHPELMQRPIIIRGDRAVLARPSEKVLELLD
jgi:arsenate reductase (glutaredoxin)